MLRLLFACTLAVLISPAFAQDYAGVTTSNAVIRQAPGPSYAQIGTVPAGTQVSVRVCFDKGTYCLVDWAGQPASGFVAGELIAIGSTGQTVLAAERAKWETIANTKPTLPEFKDYAPVEIYTEGDSYMSGAYGYSLQQYLAQATGRPVKNTAKGGSAFDLVLTRMRDPANAGHLRDTTIIWDGSMNGARSADDYMALTSEAVGLLKHDRFLIVLPGPRGEPSPGMADQAGEMIKAKWPDNFVDWRPIIPHNGNDFPDSALAAPAEDRVHLGEAPLRAMAQAIAAEIKARGW